MTVWVGVLAFRFLAHRRCPLMNRLLDYAPSAGVVVDVGANGGCEMNVALGRGRRVIGFECLHSAFQELLPVMAPHPNATLVHACASNRTALSQLHLAMDSSSLIAHNIASGPELRKVRAPNDTEPALLIPLDPILSEATVAAVKIDVQGGEFEVLQGLLDVLKRDLPAIAYEDTQRFEKHGDAGELLRGLGYNCVLIGGDQLCHAR